MWHCVVGCTFPYILMNCSAVNFQSRAAKFLSVCVLCAPYDMIWQLCTVVSPCSWWTGTSKTLVNIDIHVWFQASTPNQTRTALIWVIAQQVVVNSYRCFGTTHQSHHKESKKTILWFLTPEDGLIGCPKTSVRNYHYLLRNNPEKCSSHWHTFQCKMLIRF